MPDETKHTVLICDDDDRFRASVRRMMWMISAEFPCTCIEAESGPDAHRILTDTPVDCVLLDYQMPNGNGLDWAPRFLEVAPELAIIMVTGEGNEQIAVDAMKLGVSDYLTKGSITPTRMSRTLCNAAERQSMQHTILEQREALLVAERQRVMIESMGSVCHHLGQPMTVITTCLDIIRTNPAPTTLEALLSECTKAVERTNTTLAKLQRMTTYETEEYLNLTHRSEPAPENRIVAISEDTAVAERQEAVA